MYLDIKLLDHLRVIEYTKRIGDENSYTELKSIGLLSADNDSLYHKYNGFNKFTAQTYNLSILKNDGWIHGFDSDFLAKEYEKFYASDMTYDEYVNIRTKNFRKRVIETICDPMAKLFTPSDNSIINHHTDNSFDIYKTHDNGMIGFIVCVKKDTGLTYIYGRTKDVIPGYEFFNDVTIFDNLIAEFRPKEIFIGKSPLNTMTLCSGNHGDKWNGNSILLLIDQNEHQNKYLHIGTEIFEFTTNEKIVKYTSSVGFSEVAYPYAESKNFCYCMSNGIKIPIDKTNQDREINGYVEMSNDEIYESLDNTIFVASRAIDEVKCQNDNYCIE